MKVRGEQSSSNSNRLVDADPSFNAKPWVAIAHNFPLESPRKALTNHTVCSLSPVGDGNKIGD